jgi:hypothetical protein
MQMKSNDPWADIEEILFQDTPALKFKARARSAGIKGNLPILEPSEKSKQFKGFGQDEGTKTTNATVKGERARLDSFTLSLPPSSTIVQATYWPKKQVLQVAFKSGSTYKYEEVPMITVKMWMMAASAGSHFYYNIRMNYSYFKL